MIKIDEGVLRGMGVSFGTEEERNAFLKHVEAELEIRIGQNLTRGMSEKQIMEFELLAAGDRDMVGVILSRTPNYTEMDLYRKLLDISGDDGWDVDREFASVLWLMANKPDYKDVVRRTMDEVLRELAANRDKI
jgi:hypothetical protein